MPYGAKRSKVHRDEGERDFLYAGGAAEMAQTLTRWETCFNRVPITNLAPSWSPRTMKARRAIKLKSKIAKLISESRGRMRALGSQPARSNKQDVSARKMIRFQTSNIENWRTFQSRLAINELEIYKESIRDGASANVSHYVALTAEVLVAQT